MAVQAEPFVGREAEVELLAASLDAALRAQPRFVLVAGEAGIGKTRLLREAAEHAGRLGLRVLRGTAIEGGVAMPYLPLLAPLATCVEGASDVTATAVHRFVSGESSPGPADAAGAARLIESIFDMLVREPTALIVDDVHWADASTVAVLDYLSHRARSESLAVVVAARDDEPGRLQRLSIADGRRFVPIRLRRLTEPEVGEQLTALLGRSPEHELVAAVFSRSDGNPFFVEQLLAGDPDAAPASLRALVVRRLIQLSEPARRAVEALAVVGRAADPALLAAVAGGQQDAVEDALREASQNGVTVPEEHGYAFRHPLFPEVVVGELAGSTRRLLHRRAAEALVATGAEPAEVATHWWKAGDTEQAWAAALEAAERAERSFGFAEARLHLERALQVWPDRVDGRVACLLRAAEAAWYAGDPVAALELARNALAEEAADSPVAHLALGAYAWDVGDHAAAAAAFERAADLTRDHTPATIRAQALWALARARMGQERFAEAGAIAAEAAAIAHEASDHVAEARALFTVGSARAFEGSLDGIATIERGVALAVETGSPVAVGHGYQFLTGLVELTGELERALELASEGIDACERLGLARSHASDLRGRAALVLIDLGRWDEADAALEPAEPRALPLLAGALLAMRRGHLAKAASQLERASSAPAIGGSRSWQGELALARAELAWLVGDLAAARAALERVAPLTDVWSVAASARGARLASRVAVDDSHRAAPRALRVRHPDAALDAALRAEIAADEARSAGLPDAELWHACVRAWNQARRTYDETYARLREAEALFSLAARGRAKEALREAASSSLVLGARPLRALTEDLARRARVSPDPPRRREPDRDEPTSRELEVLAYLADGLTNREIAARLFLSPKTVGIHVSRLLRKLDAHTRGEAVAVARRRGLLD